MKLTSSTLCCLLLVPAAMALEISTADNDAKAANLVNAAQETNTAAILANLTSEIQSRLDVMSGCGAQQKYSDWDLRQCK